MDISNNTVGFTASHRRGDPHGPYYLSRIRGNALMALWPVSYYEVSRSQWVALAPATSEATPRLEVRHSEGRGFGLFTMDHIPAYTRILEDSALLSMARGEDLPQLWDKYLALPIEELETFDALSPPPYQIDKEASIISKLMSRGLSKERAQAMARVSSRFQGNAFNAGMNGGDWSHGYVLFPNVARINHSCTANAHAHYRASSGAKYVYALRDIDAGEEIEISYFDLASPLAERQRRTKGWSFTCHCPACSGALSKDYETHLSEVRTWSVVDGSTQYRPGRLEHIQHAISIAESDNTPWLRVALPHLYLNLSSALAQAEHGREASLEAARQGALWQDRITGPDSLKAFFLRRDLRAAEAKAEEFPP